jgi:hypothetical protein
MTKHHLTLRPNVVRNTRLVNDYIVRRDLRPVGRIHLANETPNAVWEWGINLPLPTPWWCMGRVSSLEEAKVAFLQAWTRFYDGLSPELIAHWHEQHDAASARLSTFSENVRPTEIGERPPENTDNQKPEIADIRDKDQPAPKPD